MHLSDAESETLSLGLSQSCPVAYPHPLLDLAADGASLAHSASGNTWLLAQNFHDRQAVVARPGNHLRKHGLTKVEEYHGYGLLNLLWLY
jgi:hypothetical protein